VPPAPTVSEVQAGGISATTIWPEIQALKIQPTFKGTYQLRRGYKKTRELSADDGPEEIQDALSSLADDGGSFSVTNPATNIAHITFNGSMAGVDHELLEVAVFSAPPGDPTINLDLNTAEIAAALRGAAELKPELEIEVTVRDENDPTKTYTLTPFRAPISLIRELNWEGLETAANIDWLRPPYGRTYIPFTPDQIITGSQHYVAPIGDGENSDFTISHNLGTRDLHVTVRENGGQFAIVEPLAVTFTGEDDLSIAFEDSPALSGYVVTISTAGPVSVFQAHSHTIPQIEGLQLILDDLGERVEVLEAFIPASNPSVSAPTQTVIAAWELPEVFEVFPTRQKIEAEDVPSIKLADLPRVGGLLPAVYVDPLVFTTANVLPVSPVSGVIYRYTNTAAPLVIPGYLGRRSTKLAAPGFFAWDGRGFYQVEQVIAGEKVFYPSDFSRELFRIHVNGKQLRLGKRLSLDFSFVAAVFNSECKIPGKMTEIH